MIFENIVLFLKKMYFNFMKNYVKYEKNIFFPGQLAFCKKAVVGLASRRIF